MKKTKSANKIKQSIIKIEKWVNQLFSWPYIDYDKLQDQKNYEYGKYFPYINTP
jgi:hypothetical protein